MLRFTSEIYILKQQEPCLSIPSSQHGIHDDIEKAAESLRAGFTAVSGLVLRTHWWALRAGRSGAVRGGVGRTGRDGHSLSAGRCLLAF